VNSSDDAWRGAVWSAALMGSGSLLGLINILTQPPGAIPKIQLAILATCLAVLGWLWSARGSDRPRLFTAVGLALVLPMFPFLPYAALRWTAIDRPFEVFARVHVILVAVPLVAWRSFRLGLALLLAFAVEAAIVYRIEQRLGNAARLPADEPTATLVFAFAALALLILCERRRAHTLRYLRAEAESETLSRVAHALESVGEELQASLHGLDALLDRARAALGGVLSDAMRGAADQLAGVREKLVALGDSAAQREVTLAADAPLSAAERALFDRDAYNSTLTCAGFIAGASTLVWLRFHDGPPPLQVAARIYACLLLLALVAIADLLRTRRRLSLMRALIWFLVLFASSLPAIAFSSANLSSRGTPFEPFLGLKVQMAILPLMLPRHRWLGFALEAVLVAETFVLYYLLDFGALRDRIPLVEPWQAPLFAIIGIALMQRREQRQMASLQRLRAERRRAALARRARLYLALGDQINSPVQVLLLGLGETAARSAADAGAVAGAIERLHAVSKQLPVVDDLLRQSLQPGVSLDGARELLRQDRYGSQ
jgi:hypothetical protein